MIITNLDFNEETKMIEYKIENDNNIYEFDIYKLLCKEFKDFINQICEYPIGKGDTKQYDITIYNTHYILYSFYDALDHKIIKIIYMNHTNASIFGFMIKDINDLSSKIKIEKLFLFICKIKYMLKNIEFLY